MADGVVVVGAVAPDARVPVLVNVDVGAVRGRADARVAAVPCRPQFQPEFVKHRVQRLHCKPHHTPRKWHEHGIITLQSNAQERKKVERKRMKGALPC